MASKELEILHPSTLDSSIFSKYSNFTYIKLITNCFKNYAEIIVLPDRQKQIAINFGFRVDNSAIIMIDSDREETEIYFWDNV